ncbi:TonB-dependent receptor family protein [Methylophaga nitratireducenticrescens]|uniref:TonB-dependent receptor family protein n=1 Tax=Methylophaga nitratireducenticrescens TaxID=754476 RepID=UPI000CDBD84D|nr:TonB-dependent receptor [Methylophaga nitratireducenticrescens]AUZ84726.1 TonB-dependent siderophore receptor [Methylophaga nitratireducenticrescens]AUZ84728.1 TonB-dependent siderophore receptor [Methylophaga nitratireducenticrescens]AUZ84730.1 TonB-dependent siderophore receptor [Methylophaga nitratireducenticrescens]AUZ84732.1 TonB-dependent siderophore receptor [Methylophaga nitratireducenticrescens]
MKLKPLIVMQALAIGSYSMAASAEEPVNAEFKMPALQVVGSEADSISRQTGAVIIIDREEIERIQPTSTEDVLRRVPGINVKTEEESAVVSNVGIRGLSASESKSLILEDGVPVAPGLFIGNDRYFNPRIQRMEGIEILKGSSSLRYGPSTIGGVINYQTKTPDDGVHLSTRFGSFNTREATLEAGGRTESGDSFAGIVATRALSDGFMDKDYRMSDIMIKAGTKLNENHSLGVKYSYYQNEANISYRGLFLDDYKSGRTYNPAPDDYFLTDRRAVDINHEWHLTDNATLTTLAYWSEVSRDYWRYGVNTAASNDAGRWVYTDSLNGNNRSFERYGIETRLAVDHNLFGISNQAEFGLRFMQEESDDKTIGATRANDRSGTLNKYLRDEADSVAGYVQNRFEITDRFAVTPGIRIESYEQKRNVLVAQEVQQQGKVKTNNTEVLPGIGATYQLIPEAQLYGGVYKAFSPASNGTSLVSEDKNLVDQKLDGERSVNYELGVRGEIDRMTYELTGFYMDFDNLVVTGNSDPNLSRSNAGESKHYGLEAALGYELGGGFSVDTNLTWVPYSRFEAGENSGNRLPYSPKFLANVALNYTQGKFSSSLTAHHRGEQYGDPTNLEDIPNDAAGGIWGGEMSSYTVYDFFAQYQVSEQFRVRGAVKNLTDKHYITGLRQGIYVGPERSFEVGFDYSF